VSRKPTLSNSLPRTIERTTMPLHLTKGEELAYCTVRLEVTTALEKSTGTGFFFRFEDGSKKCEVIVTNRHVVEGALSIRFYLTKADGEVPGTTHNTFDLSNLGSYWTNHPDPNIDLAVMPASPLLESVARVGFKPFVRMFRQIDVATDADLRKLSPGDDILMIGYPVGIWDSVNNAPIFRKGIAATHPGKHYEGKPEFLIDAASFPGSSGSPVVVHDLIYYDRDKHAIAWNTSGSRTKLLGILHSVVQYTAEGEIQIVPVPTTIAPAPVPTAIAPTATAPVPTVNKPIVLTPLMANIGVIVRAEKLFDIEPILRSKFPI
jgi:Trypsin-like peptidase domain